jgi:hypothetical protein
VNQPRSQSVAARALHERSRSRSRTILPGPTRQRTRRARANRPGATRASRARLARSANPSDVDTVPRLPSGRLVSARLPGKKRWNTVGAPRRLAAAKKRRVIHPASPRVSGSPLWASNHRARVFVGARRRAGIARLGARARRRSGLPPSAWATPRGAAARAWGAERTAAKSSPAARAAMRPPAPRSLFPTPRVDRQKQAVSRSQTKTPRAAARAWRHTRYCGLRGAGEQKNHNIW